MQWAAEHAWHTTHLRPFLEHVERSGELHSAQSMYSPRLRQLVGTSSALRRYEDALHRDYGIGGLAPGQIAAPVRVGRQQPALWSGLPADDAGLEARRVTQVMSLAILEGGPGQLPGRSRGTRCHHHHQSPPPHPRTPLLACQVVACRHFSAAVTQEGEVWTFGASFTGGLGGGAEWSSAGEARGWGAEGGCGCVLSRTACAWVGRGYAQHRHRAAQRRRLCGALTAARQVEGALRRVLADNGGAVKLAAGGAFCAALTRSGLVVLWGQPRGAAAGAAAVEAAGGEGGNEQLGQLRVLSLIL